MKKWYYERKYMLMSWLYKRGIVPSTWVYDARVDYMIALFEHVNTIVEARSKCHAD